MKITKIYQGDFWASGFEQYEILDMSKWGVLPDNPEPLNPAKYLTEITIDKVDYNQDIFFQFENGYICWYSGIARYTLCFRDIQLDNQEGSFFEVKKSINNIFDFIDLIKQARSYTIRYNGHIYEESSGYNVVFVFNHEETKHEECLIYFPNFRFLYGALIIKSITNESYVNYFINKADQYFKFS